jgi:RHS repeat-associated protein
VYDGDGRRVKSIFNGNTTTYFVGNHYEVTGSTITKYYYAGGQRIAMRTNGTLNYLLGDHLGSTSLTTNASGQVVSELGYKAWGETRYASGNTLTNYQYTGQYSYEPDFGLLFYHARWYDPYLNHFTQPDSIVSDQYNSLDWNRYSYARNNPVRYTDPSGHSIWEGDSGGECEKCIVEFRIKYHRDLLFRKMFLGSNNGAWTTEDWKTYLENRDFYYDNPDEWINPDPPGVEGWARRIERLAAHYDVEDRDAFVRDFAFMYAALPYDGSWVEAALSAFGGPPTDDYIHESNDGLNPDFIDSRKDWENQSHHYAGIFFLGYFAGQEIASGINEVRDNLIRPNAGDVNLGEVAASDGAAFHSMLPSDLADLIRDLGMMSP